MHGRAETMRKKATKRCIFLTPEIHYADQRLQADYSRLFPEYSISLKRIAFPNQTGAPALRAGGSY